MSLIFYSRKWTYIISLTHTLKTLCSHVQHGSSTLFTDIARKCASVLTVRMMGRAKTIVIGWSLWDASIFSPCCPLAHCNLQTVSSQSSLRTDSSSTKDGTPFTRRCTHAGFQRVYGEWRQVGLPSQCNGISGFTPSLHWHFSFCSASLQMPWQDIVHSSKGWLGKLMVNRMSAWRTSYRKWLSKMKEVPSQLTCWSLQASEY